MDDRELSLFLVGINYPNADGSSRRFALTLCRPDDPIELRPEPKNKQDRNAVGVFTERGGQLGYLSAERAPWIGAKLRAGEEYVAIFQSDGAMAAAIRVRFGGGAPTLPPPRPADQPVDDDFVPDPDPGEWGA